MKKALFTIFVLLTSQAALAQYETQQSQEHPQYFFQAAEGQHLLTPELIVQKTAGKIATMAEREISSTALRASYEYGIFDWLAVGGKLSLADTRIEIQSLTSNSSGFEDLDFYVRTFYRFENFNFRYGLEFNVSPEAQKFKSNGLQANEYSGANTVTPYAGIDIPLGTSTIGLKWSHGILLGKQVAESSIGQKFKSTGGTSDSFEAFYEYKPNSENIWGAAFAYVTTTDEKDEAGVKDEKPSAYGINLYSANKVSDQWTLLPNFIYATNAQSSVNNLKIESLSTWALSFAARYSF